MGITGIIWRTKSGFEKLFREHYPVLCAYAYGFVSDYSLSEDIVQDVFLKFWSDRWKIAINTSVKSYLYKAVGNSAFNYIKHQKVIRQYETEKKNDDENEERSAEDIMSVKELDAKIQSAMSGLPDGQRKIFMMSRMDGLKYREIAYKLGISVKTVENQMGKALAGLRRDLYGDIPRDLYRENKRNNM